MTYPAGLQTYIWNNNLRCLLLLAIYPFLLLGLVWACGAAVGMFSGGGYGQPPWPAAQAFGNRVVIEYWPLVLTVVAIWFAVAYFFNTRMMRMLSHARPVARREEPELYNLLENLCISRGLRMPGLEVIETDALNAYASGIDEKSFSITVTRGLMQRLQRDELEAVLGHELTHIINRDVRLLVISVIFTGMLRFAAQMIWSNIRYGLYYRSRSRDRGRGNAMLLMLVIGVILWAGYMATMFTRFALSRRREYMADAGSVQLTRNPEGMIRALQRLQGHDRIPGIPEDVALMCTANSSRFMGLFATHPPLEDRIRAIAALTGARIPQETADFRNPWA